MIRTEKEYKTALQKLRQNEEALKQQQEYLQSMNLSDEQIELALSPLQSFYHQLQQEVKGYERIKNRDWEFIDQLANLQHIGQFFIALRIAYGLSQRDFAKLLGVSEPQVSKDEKNEYHGISLERVIRIFEILRVHTTHLQPDKNLHREDLLGNPLYDLRLRKHIF